MQKSGCIGRFFSVYEPPRKARVAKKPGVEAAGREIAFALARGRTANYTEKEAHYGERHKQLIPYKMEPKYPGSIYSEGAGRHFWQKAEETTPYTIRLPCL